MAVVKLPKLIVGGTKANYGATQPDHQRHRLPKLITDATKVEVGLLPG